MKRMVTAAALVAAVWMFAAGHVDATTTKGSHHESTCKKVNAALDSGQSMKAVEKQFKVSSKTVHKCQEQKTASAAHPQRSNPQAH
jgi:ABC-type phosphate/phosphonate transport system substrate-binding protein